MNRSLVAIMATILLSTPSFGKDRAGAIQNRILQGRATEAVVWGMPVVNYDLMRQQMLTRTAGKVNQFIYWGRPLDWHNQTLTPNPDTLYFMAFFDTRDGPLVLDIPPADAGGSLNANIVNVWQMPFEDAGLLGVDKGKGVKFVILPPGYADNVPDGYTPLRYDTYGGYVLLRSNLASHGGADVAKSIAYGKRARLYPLSQAADPPETVFTDVKDVLFDSTIRYDASFFDNLNRLVQEEPWLGRDRAMIDQLRSLGIEKGKPFKPDKATTRLFGAAAGDAHVWLAARYDAGLPPFWDKSRWTMPAFPELVQAAQTGFDAAETYPVDIRGLTYTYGYIGIKRLGAGQFYLISIRDKDGHALDGARTYNLKVPPNVPVDQYWSVTAYDRETHALIRNMDRASRASNAAEVRKNADGSVEIWFGPKAPKGKEANWVPTDPRRKFELMFRLYGPRKEFFDKQWVLPDLQKMQAR